MKIGIDRLSFYVPKYYLDLNDLANYKKIDPLKYTVGLLQNKMAVAPFYEDIITLAANAANQVLTPDNINEIDMVLFATESGLDFSKSAATTIVSLLGLNKNVRSLEIKHACYSATAALYFAKGHILQNPNSKVLVIASDIAKYGIGSDGEPTQGAGAVAMIISKDPNVVVINDMFSFSTQDIYDFFRPNGHEFAIVDGKYSNQMFKKMFIEVYEDYINKSKTKLTDYSSIIFHTPYSKIGLRTLQLIADNENNLNLFNNFELATIYNKEVGNIYAGSLYLSLISLLENSEFKSNDLIGLYSYGSGAVAEFYSVSVVEGYKNHLYKEKHESLLVDRKALSIEQYHKYINHNKNENQLIEDENFDGFNLIKIENHIRYYKKFK